MSEKYINLKLNGASVKVKEGTSVLNAAMEYGVCIPNLCNVQGLEAIGSCRLCIVEVVKNGKSKVTASCSLEAKDGMYVLTHSPKILKARKNIAEMLVAEAPNSKAVQDVAARCGVTKVRYKFRNADCIQCGRCVRVCKEMWQSKSLGFVGRGNKRHVALPFNKRPDTCKRCWTCVDMCLMTTPPCPGPIKTGKEYLCNRCGSQISMAANTPDTCVWCELGKGFDCARYQ
jgi:bidirectional [NiFe] hydrogenase diaphorase subunit